MNVNKYFNLKFGKKNFKLNIIIILMKREELIKIFNHTYIEFIDDLYRIYPEHLLFVYKLYIHTNYLSINECSEVLLSDFFYYIDEDKKKYIKNGQFDKLINNSSSIINKHCQSSQMMKQAFDKIMYYWGNANKDTKNTIHRYLITLIKIGEKVN